MKVLCKMCHVGVVQGVPKSSFLTEEKRARLKTNPVKVHFAEEVLVGAHSQVRHSSGGWPEAGEAPPGTQLPATLESQSRERLQRKCSRFARGFGTTHPATLPQRTA